MILHYSDWVVFFTDKPSKQVLTDALSLIDDKWFEFGIKVGLERRVLNRFKYDPHPLSAVVEHWHGGNVLGGLPVSWRSVLTALEKMEEHGLAKHIQDSTFVLLL